MRKLSTIFLLGGLLLIFALAANAQVTYWIQYDDGTTAFYSGRPLPNDTLGVWFEPPTESQILAGRFMFNNNMGGPALIYIWGLAANFDPASRIVAMSFCEPRSW